MHDRKDQSSYHHYKVGGNFFELIEFTLERHLENDQVITGTYGVNVAKVREVVHMPKINPLGSSGKGVAGMFELRGVPIPAVNLCQVLGDKKAPIATHQQIIVTEFSQKRAGFIVSATRRIRRVSWEKVLPPSTDHQSCMTGMILLENHDFLFILDLERILLNIEASSDPENSNPHLRNPLNAVAMESPRPQLYSNAPVILVVDDSRLVLKTVTQALERAGFRVITALDGREAYEKVMAITSGFDQTVRELAGIVSDIEMPQMDGITLVSKLRNIPEIAKVPIIFHTSLDGGSSKEAAKKAGADGYVLKNDLATIVNAMSQFVQQGRVSIAT